MEFTGYARCAEGVHSYSHRTDVEQLLTEGFDCSLGVVFGRESVEGEDGGEVCDKVVDEFHILDFG